MAHPSENTIWVGGEPRSSRWFGPDYLSELERVLAQYVRPVTRCYLEWGMGNTTLAVLEMRHRLAIDDFYSIDDNRDYMDALVAQFPTWTGFHPLHGDLTGPKLDDRDPGLSYSTLPLSLGRRFDFIFIDGRRRMECALTASLVCHRHSIVALHDYRRARYQHVTALFDIVEDGSQFRVMRPKSRLSKAKRSAQALARAIRGRLGTTVRR